MDAEGFVVSQLQMHLFRKRKFVAFKEAGKKTRRPGVSGGGLGLGSESYLLFLPKIFS